MPDYDSYSPLANKLLNPDGSITTFDGTVVTPADETRSRDYLSRTPLANKVVNPDGTITLITSGGFGGVAVGTTLTGDGVSAPLDVKEKSLSHTHMDFYNEVPLEEGQRISEVIITADYPLIEMNKGLNTDGTTADADGFYYTGKIPVAQNIASGTTVEITASGFGADFNWVFWNADGAVIGSLSWNNYSYPIPLPAGTAAVGTTGQTALKPSAEVRQSYQTPKSTAFNDPHSVVFDTQVVSTKYEGLKMGCIGDSLTKAEGYTGWKTLVAQRLRFDSVDYQGNGYIALGQMTTQYYDPENPNDEYKPMILRAEDLSADCDVIFFFPGVAEIKNSTPSGSWNDPMVVDPTHFVVNWVPSMRVMCQKLINKFPGKPVYCILPLNIRSDTAFTVRRTFAQLAADVCAQYGVRVIDPSNAGLSLYFLSEPGYSMFTTDGIHLTDRGHQKLADEIIRVMIN
jgi:hypothetical protein